MDCKHSAWLQIVAPSILQDFNRLQSMIDTGVFANPDQQVPSLVTFVGGVEKERILRSIIDSKVQPMADVHLHIDSSTSTKPNPILIADCNVLPPKHSKLGFNKTSCHEITTRRLICAPQTRVSILAKLLSPFTNILCIFMSDFENLEDVATFLETWVTANKSSVPQHHPRLIVIREDPGALTH
jgi:hypothetical protein